MGKKIRKVSFSNEQLILDEINNYYESIVNSNKLYYSVSNPNYEIIFATMTVKEVKEQLDLISKENEKLVSFNILAALEAAFRIDYLFRSKRINKNKTDILSQQFYNLFLSKENHARLEGEILEAWKDNAVSPKDSRIISDLKGVFKYRLLIGIGLHMVDTTSPN